ncbi:ATP-binding cassette domain-containing protein [Leucobacter sp. GX24907]
MANDLSDPRRRCGARAEQGGEHLPPSAPRVTALRGASGGGKTTIARTFAGFASLGAGRLEFRGSALPNIPRHRTRAQRRAIQLVTQHTSSTFNPRRTIRQSLLDARPEIEPSSLLSRLHLDHELLDRFPHQLSGGQQQRLALLRALSVRPDVLILDEPASALDPETSQRVLATIRGIVDEGSAVLLITHDDAPRHEIIDDAFELARGSLARTQRARCDRTGSR